MFQFSFWVSYIKWVSLIFVGLGLMWAFVGSFDPFGIYDTWMSQTFFGRDELGFEVERVSSFILAPFGITSAGYFVLQYFIAKHAYAKKEAWAYRAIVFAFVFWFVVDTGLSLYHGAYFNVMLANLPALSLMLPWMLLAPKFREV